MSKEDLIKQYIKTVTGREDIGVEIVEDQPVLSREGLWHIYFIPRFTFIGVFIDEDVDFVETIRGCVNQILDIYENGGE